MAVRVKARRANNERMAKPMANMQTTKSQTLVRLMAMTMTKTFAQRTCEIEIKARTKIQTTTSQKSRLTKSNTKSDTIQKSKVNSIKSHFSSSPDP